MTDLPELTTLEWTVLRLCALGITRRQLRKRGVGFLLVAETLRTWGLANLDGARFTLCQGGVNLLYRKAVAEQPALVAQVRAEVAALGLDDTRADVAERNMTAWAMGEGV